MKKLLGIVVLGLLLSGNAYSEQTLILCTKDEGKDKGFSNSYLIDTEKKQIYFKNNKTSKNFKELKNIIIYETESDVYEYVVELDRFTGKKKVLWRPIDKNKQKKMGLKEDEYESWTETCVAHPKKIF